MVTEKQISMYLLKFVDFNTDCRDYKKTPKSSSCVFHCLSGTSHWFSFIEFPIIRKLNPALTGCYSQTDTPYDNSYGNYGPNNSAYPIAALAMVIRVTTDKRMAMMNTWEDEAMKIVLGRKIMIAVITGVKEADGKITKTSDYD